MAAKKAPAKKVSSSKKPASAADFRKADQASMAKYKSGVGRTDAKGNKGMGASKSNSHSLKPGFAVHNDLRAFVVGGGL